jgi:hypothetical protein
MECVFSERESETGERGKMEMKRPFEVDSAEYPFEDHWLPYRDGVLCGTGLEGFFPVVMWNRVDQFPKEVTGKTQRDLYRRPSELNAHVFTCKKERWALRILNWAEKGLTLAFFDGIIESNE